MENNNVSVGVGPDNEQLIVWEINGLHFEVELFPNGRVELFLLQRDVGSCYENELTIDTKRLVHGK